MPVTWMQQEGQRGQRSEEIYTRMNMPPFDAMNFPQWLDSSQAPFDGLESSLNGFFGECQLYFGSLLDPKLKEGQ